MLRTMVGTVKIGLKNLISVGLELQIEIFFRIKKKNYHKKQNR